MRRISIGMLFVLFFGASCGAPATISAAATDTAAAASPLEAVPTEPPPDNGITSTVVPPLPIPIHARWQIQYTGDIDLSLDVDVYNLDLFDTDAAYIAQLRGRGIFVMCYFSAGSFEDWRPDAGEFPPQVLGKAMEGWEGETWLDIHQIDLLRPIMEARLNLAVKKGCDGVDPDNVNGYTNDTGFPLTYEDQIRFNIFLAESAHQRGLKIGLKNDLEQIPDLLPYFDWELNEECFSFDECSLLLPFIEAGKPVFVIQYDTPPGEFCPQAEEMNFNAMQKNWELDAFRVPCESDYE